MANYKGGRGVKDKTAWQSYLICAVPRENSIYLRIPLWFRPFGWKRKNQKRPVCLHLFSRNPLRITKILLWRNQKKRVPLLRNLLHRRERRACLNRRPPMARLRNRGFRALLPLKNPWPLPLLWHGWSKMDMVISNRKETV